MVDRDDGCAERDVDAARSHEERPVAERAADPREVAALPPHLVVGAAAGEDDELVPGPAERACDALQQLRAERLDVDDEHADHVRPAAPQALGDEARVVAEILDHRPHARLGLLGDAPAAVDHLRHGRHRDAGLGGDVADRQPPLGHGAILTHIETDIDNG